MKAPSGVGPATNYPLRLGAKELRYLQDTDFLLTKLQLQKDLQRLLEQVQAALQHAREGLDLPSAAWEVAPKISRGENYGGLPYLVLDYPRIFKQEATFAYRCMFWWGHGFSCTLHLGGYFWEQYQQRILARLPQIPEQDWWIGVHNSPWEYHYHSDNYLPLQDLLKESTELTAMCQKSFFKISRRLPLEQYQAFPAFCLENLQQLSHLLHD